MSHVAYYVYNAVLSTMLHIKTHGNMQVFIRFTENIHEDLKRGTSIITTNDNAIVDGLCVFYGEDDIEKAHAKAQRLGRICAESGDKYFIIKGKENIVDKAGSLGTLMYADDATVLGQGVVK